MSTGNEQKVVFKLGITPDERAQAAMTAAKRRMQGDLEDIGKTAKSTSADVRRAMEEMVDVDISQSELADSMDRFAARSKKMHDDGIRHRRIATEEWAAMVREVETAKRSVQQFSLTSVQGLQQLAGTLGQATRGFGALQGAMRMGGPMGLMMAGQGIMDTAQMGGGLMRMLGRGSMLKGGLKLLGGGVALKGAQVAGGAMFDMLAPQAAMKRRRHQIENSGISRLYNSAGAQGLVQGGREALGTMAGFFDKGPLSELGTAARGLSSALDQLTVKGNKVVERMEREAELRDQANARRQALANATDQFERATSGNRRSMLARRHALGNLTDMEKNSDQEILAQSHLRKFRAQASMAETTQAREAALERVRETEERIVQLNEQAFQIHKRNAAERKSEGQAELDRLKQKIELIRNERDGARNEGVRGAARFGAMSEIDRAAALELKRRFDSGEKLTRGQLGRLRGFSGDLDRKIETEFARRAQAGGFGAVFTENAERQQRLAREEAKAVALHDNRKIVVNLQIQADQAASDAVRETIERKFKEMEARFEEKANRQRDVAEERANQAPRPS